MPTPPKTQNIFDTVETWKENPETAFASWVNEQEFKESTKHVYITMFSNYCQWMRQKNVKVEYWESQHLAEFLESSGLKKNQRQRYLVLIERAFNHMWRLGYKGDNPGRRAGFQKLGGGLNDPTHFLSQEERTTFINQLLSPRPTAASDDPSDWIYQRDIALSSVLMGGGAKTAQALRVTVNCIDLKEGLISLGDDRQTRRHRARLLPFAIGVLENWLKARAALPIPGDLLFPTDREGPGVKPWPMKYNMHPSTAFLRVQLLLQSCGIKGDRACPQTLRNTYAAILIEEGVSNELLAEYLGMVQLRSAKRIRSSLKSMSLQLAESMPEQSRQHYLQGLDEDLRKTLLHTIRNHWAHASVTFDGNRLTLGELGFVVDEGITIASKSLRDHLQASGYVKALDLLMEIAREDRVIDTLDLFDLHRLVMSAESSDRKCPVGAWKQLPNGRPVMDPSDGLTHHLDYAAPADVPALVNHWLVALNVPSGELGDRAMACRYADHLMSFLRVSPFCAGNGMVARMVANLPLLRAGYPPIIMPSERASEYQRLLDAYDLLAGPPRVGVSLLPLEVDREAFRAFCEQCWGAVDAEMGVIRARQASR